MRSKYPSTASLSAPIAVKWAAEIACAFTYPVSAAMISSPLSKTSTLLSSLSAVAFIATPSANGDGRDDGHPRAELVIAGRDPVEHDLHRHALDDLHEVAGGILGWQQAEPRARAGLDAVDVALEDEPRIRVDLDDGRLARAHPREL